MSINQTVQIDCGVSTAVSSASSEIKHHKNESHETTSDDETLKTANIVVVGRPKRPLSAYNLFFQDERRRLISSRAMAASSRRVGFAEMAKTIAAKWHKIDPESKSRYDAITKQEKARHRRTIAEWKKINKENNNNAASLKLSSNKRKQMDPLMGDIDQLEEFASKKKKTSPKAATKAMTGDLKPCEPEEAERKVQNEKPASVEPPPVTKPAPSPQVELSPIETVALAALPAEKVAPRGSFSIETETVARTSVDSFEQEQHPTSTALEAPSPLPTEAKPSPLPTEVAPAELPTEVTPSPLPTEAAPSPLPTEVAPSPINNQVEPTQFVPAATSEEPNKEWERFAAYWGIMSVPMRVLATNPSAQPQMMIGLDRLVQDLKDLQSLELFVDMFTSTNPTTATDGN